MDLRLRGSRRKRENHRPQFFLAFAIGTLVGIGLAATWIPEKRRKRVQAKIGQGYRQIRDSGASALREARTSGERLLGEFREELGGNVEAAREELRDIAHDYLDGFRKALQRERNRLRG